jgi:NADPH:quinone reductase-like Zn-dependent oxidoreductase
MRVRATGLIVRDSALMRGSYSGGRVPTRIPLSDNAGEVLALTAGRGADIVLNTVGHAEMERCLMACADNARLVHIGSGKAQAPFNALPNLMVRNVTFKGITVGSRRMFEDLLKAIVANRISPIIDRVFPFERALEAVGFFESGERLGKVVIEVG